MTDGPDYLLDTNMLSDLVRNPGGVVAEHIACVGEGAIATSVIVEAELRYGAERSDSRQLRSRVTEILSLIRILEFDSLAASHYAVIRDALARKGTPIGPNDLLIAAHARALVSRSIN